MAVKPLVPNPVYASASALIANLASTAWDGTPPTPEVSRPHWLLHLEDQSEPDIADWHCDKWWFPGINQPYTPNAVSKSYRYLGPAARPEAEALADAYCDFVVKQEAINSTVEGNKPLVAWQEARNRLQQAELAYRAALRRG